MGGDSSNPSFVEFGDVYDSRVRIDQLNMRPSVYMCEDFIRADVTKASYVTVACNRAKPDRNQWNLRSASNGTEGCTQSVVMQRKEPDVTYVTQTSYAFVIGSDA